MKTLKEQAMSWQQVDIISQVKLTDKNARIIYDKYKEIGIHETIIKIVSSLPTQEQQPYWHTLTAHIMKEKSINVYSLGESLGINKEIARDIAGVVDFLWVHALMLDDILDKDETRAGSMSAWKKFGVSETMAALRSGFTTLELYLTEKYPIEITSLCREYYMQAVRSTRSHKSLTLDSSISDVIDNYDKRANFQSKFPIIAMAIISGETGNESKYQKAFNSLLTLDNAGQFFNDVKDFVSTDWRVNNFSDIRSALVTVPIILLWRRLNEDEKQKFLTVFGKEELNDLDRKFLAEIITPEVISEWTQIIEEVSILGQERYSGIVIEEELQEGLNAFIAYRFAVLQKVLY